MSAIDRTEFLREFTRALREDTAALFVGAGLSVGAGFVDWKSLLRDVATDIGLDVERETDLVELAQFHVNHRHGRDRINQILIDRFVEDVSLTENHRLIATLPVRAVWTSNYDNLIEKGFEAADKRVDIKRRQSDFAHTRRNADVAIYKMHGDETDPAEAVLTKEDYETYNRTRELFTIALKGDLANRTFLFLGFSFADPNVGHILSRVRSLLERDARQHYCLIKNPRSGECGDDDYSCTRFPHWLGDLRRYGIIPVLIDAYSEITDILAELQRRCRLRDALISGSAHDFSPLGRDRFRELCRLLGCALMQKGFSVISGFGQGVGDLVIVGAMETLRRNDGDRLRLWPFPQEVPAGTDRESFWKSYREQMISHSGIVVVLAGNKLEAGNVVAAEGVRQEVEMARVLRKVVIPIGATGSVARDVWNQATTTPAEFYGVVDVSRPLATLGDESATPQRLVDAVLEIAQLMDR